MECRIGLVIIQYSVLYIQKSTQMLPKKNRIQRKDFPSHKVHGIRVFSQFFTAVFYKTTNESRCTIVISKKTAKKAVIRNSQRRKFYELIAPYLRTTKAPIMIVLYPKVEAQKIDFLTLKTEIERVFKQANLT